MHDFETKVQVYFWHAPPQEKKNVKKDGNPGRVLYIRLLIYFNILDFCIALILVLLFTYSFQLKNTRGTYN